MVENIIHLNVNSIKFIKAGPSSRASKTFEEFSHGHEIKLVAAVEYNGLNRQSLAQILCCLSLACASRTCGSTSKLEMKSSGQCQVAPVINENFRYYILME